MSDQAGRVDGEQGSPSAANAVASATPRLAWLALVVGAAGLAVAAWVLWKNRFFFHDDCYIALRYARNLLHGHGLVWNPGERVEGYSSLAAVLAAAGLGATGVPLPLAARVLNGIGLACAALAVGRFARRRGLPLPASVSLAVLVAGYAPLGVWVMGGLEAPLFAGALAWAAAATCSRLECDPDPARDAAAAAGLGALVLVRPDAAWFGAVAAAAYAARLARVERDRRLRCLLAFAAAGLALPAAQLAFRLAYYGEWLPNPVIAKLVGLPDDPRILAGGLDYLWRFATSAPVALALALSLLGLRRREARAPLSFLLCSALGHAALVATAGGDHMVEVRLLAPLLPLLALGSVYGLQGLPWSDSRQPLALAVAVLVALGLQPLASTEHRPDPAAWLGESVGRHLADRFPAGALVAANSAGATAFFAPHLRFLDMLGLNDAHIARRRVERFELDWQAVPGHAKGDGAYVLERRPDVVILGPVDGRSADEPWFLSDLELARDPTFARDYALATVDLDVRDRRFHRAYARTRDGTLTLHYYRRRPQASDASPERLRTGSR